jgi:hypothetical protein
MKAIVAKYLYSRRLRLKFYLIEYKINPQGSKAYLDVFR